MDHENLNIKLNIKQTLLCNVLYPYFVLLGYLLIKLLYEHYLSLADETLSTVTIIFMIFSSTKIIFWIGKPILVWNER